MNKRLDTFTIGSDSQVHDESERAQEYADLIGSDHKMKKVSAATALEMLDEVMDCVREPMADFSVLPTYLVSRFARRHVKVALSGDGGDELFFGYERFWSIAKNIKYQTLPWLMKAALYKADKILTKNSNLNSAVLPVRQGAAHRNLHCRFPKEWIERIFPDLIDVKTPERYSVYGFPNSRHTHELIQSMRRAEFYGMMQKTLRKVDLASMGASLEVRVPFLKKSFLEAVLTIDPMLSYGPNRKKLLLKGLLRKLYPMAPIDNVKRGFSVPLGRWFAEKQFKATVQDKLLRPSFLETFGGEPKGIRALLDHHGYDRDLKWPIFTLLALQNQTHSGDRSAVRNSAFASTGQ
jgi:asparagine synthase (glutamine-hydrolysing)